MKLIGNILWLIFGGLIWAALWFIMGLVFCITIIGIPVGIVCFKTANLVIWPFGRDVKTNFDEHPLGNILWIIFVGWHQCVGFFFTGVIFCITIIGIPFGRQWFKLAKLALLPFGATITEAS